MHPLYNVFVKIITRLNKALTMMQKPLHEMAVLLCCHRPFKLTFQMVVASGPNLSVNQVRTNCAIDLHLILLQQINRATFMQLLTEKKSEK